MSAPARLLLIAAALAATLAACNREREAEPSVAAPGSAAVVTPADAAAPLKFETKTPYAEVSLVLPEGLKPWFNIWSAGQGIELIDDIPTVAELVRRLRAEYVEACEIPSMADVARLVDRAQDALTA